MRCNLLPSGYISKKQELIAQVKAMSAAPTAGNGGSGGTGIAKDNIDSMRVQGGPGNGQLQRALNRMGA